jgi:hypothetical protein
VSCHPKDDGVVIAGFAKFYGHFRPFESDLISREYSKTLNNLRASRMIDGKDRCVGYFFVRIDSSQNAFFCRTPPNGGELFADHGVQMPLV